MSETTLLDDLKYIRDQLEKGEASTAPWIKTLGATNALLRVRKCLAKIEGTKPDGAVTSEAPLWYGYAEGAAYADPYGGVTIEDVGSIQVAPRYPAPFPERLRVLVAPAMPLADAAKSVSLRSRRLGNVAEQIAYCSAWSCLLNPGTIPAYEARMK